MINNVNISTSSFFLLSFQGAPTMYESPNTPHAGSLSKIIVQSPEQEQQRRKNNQSSPHLCTVQKHLFSRESNKFTLLCAKNKNNAENNRPMHKWNFKKTVDDNTSGSKNNKAIKSIGYSEFKNNAESLILQGVFTWSHLICRNCTCMKKI